MDYLAILDSYSGSLILVELTEERMNELNSPEIEGDMQTYVEDTLGDEFRFNAIDVSWMVIKNLTCSGRILEFIKAHEN